MQGSPHDRTPSVYASANDELGEIAGAFSDFGDLWHE
jgi:hypothetical protein